MVKVTDDGLFPVPRAKVWKLIEAHGTDLQAIHPGVKSFKLLRKEGNSDVVEQHMDMNGRDVKVVLKLTPNPPDKLTLDFLEGAMLGKKSPMMDDKQLEGAVREFLNNGFNDDLRYLNTKMK